MEPSVFTKIMNGEIPCHKVYEDELTFAFMDIHPLQPGHILVVPKKQVDLFDDLSEDDYNAVFKTVKKISKILRKHFQTSRTTLLVMGYDVPHAHVHLIPSDSAEDIDTAYLNRHKTSEKEPDHDELAKQAVLIRQALNS